ncbi:MAG: DUF3047 domain-containing protein [Deltaproteobacteria bacterium]|nr:DUF3047 domain-containing protein [Deltaproteobacteria bacterium]
MARVWAFLMVAMMVFVTGHPGLGQADPNKSGDDTFQKVNFFLDFSDYSEGSVEDWLKNKGFVFERDAKNRKKLDLNVGNEGLILEAKAPLTGLMLNERVDLEEFSSIRIEWGVNQYPEGASYEKKVNNEALMVIVFFGYDKISSGNFLIPNAPYFIGFFPGKNEQVGKGYLGRYFKKSGRYVCLGNPEPGKTVISEYDLISAFKKEYEKDEAPIISGLALEVDTSSSGNGGKAVAFIKSIEFLE